MYPYAARRFARRPFRRRLVAAGAVTASLALCGSGVATATDDANPVVVQPDPVAPGDEFSVFDGGNCTGGSGEATFEDADIPKLKLSMLRNQVGGTATVPRSLKPGAYTVTVTCGDGKDGELAPQSDAEREARGDGGAGHGHGEPGTGAHGRARLTFTGTLTVSGGARTGADAGADPDANAESHADAGPKGAADAGADAGTDAGPGQVVPRGGADTGLGGGSGVGTGVTVLGGVLLAGALGWGVVAYLRRPRSGRG
ncbi:hypothetical protein ACIRPT_25505 [Streptomyces sp. NPDC101227]|uniref:hypothetical protein n=1 Tax=Streptomyces sp. NPDC101227 TaxID=3366136 RepID=UPI003820321A